MFNVLQVNHQILYPKRCPLADGGKLCRLEVRKSESRHILVLHSKIGKKGYYVYNLFPYKFERLCHYDNICVIAHITARCAEVDYALCLGALNAVGIDVAHNIVANLLFTFFGNVIVDVVCVCFKLGNLFVGYFKSKLLFRLGKCNPQSAPGFKLFVRRKEILHFIACVP